MLRVACRCQLLRRLLLRPRLRRRPPQRRQPRYVRVERVARDSGGKCAFALPNSQPSRLLDARSRMSPIQQPAAPKSRHEYIERFCGSCDADAHQCADGCPQQCTHSRADCEAYCRADVGAHNRPNSSAHQCANGIPDDFAHNRPDAGRRIHRVRADADAATNASPPPPPHVLDLER